MHLAKRQGELRLKLAYVGPGLAGKSTNITQLHQSLPPDRRGPLVRPEDEARPTLSFDYMAGPSLPGGLPSARVTVMTVTGRACFDPSDPRLLEGVNGVVFVADSRRERESANLVSRDELIAGLERAGSALDRVPHVYQWNRRDAPDAVKVAHLERVLNPERAPSVPATAIHGLGVLETLAAIGRRLLGMTGATVGLATVLQ